MQYQVQEMLRAERIFEPEGIAEELEAYNPLIPDGSNLKATLMIEYPIASERARRLAELRGFERDCWMRVAGFEPVYAIADEDLARENETKTSAVHFLRFEFTAPMIAALRERRRAGGRRGLTRTIGTASIRCPRHCAVALLADFD